MPLTAAAVRSAKPKKKIYRLFDAGGLYLEVSPRGGKWWRVKYRFGGKEKRLALGTYPDVPLKEAREQRDRAREMLRKGIDPSAHKQAVKAAQAAEAENSFEMIAREWFEKQTSEWTEGHAKTVSLRMKNDLFPWIGERPITELTPSELLKVLRRVEERGARETAHRIQVILGQVFRYAIITDRLESDPSRDLKGALLAVKPQHLAAITDPKRVGDLLRAIDGYEGSHVVRCALRFAPLVFVRPGELRHARWEDIDEDKAEWRFLATKTKTPHIVPLAKQVLAVIEDLRPVTESSEWLFPGVRSHQRPMSNNTICAALRSLGFQKEEMSAHGFRALARTLLDEELGERVDLIEHQLAHKVRDPLGRAYNRTKHLPERRAMMQRWADFLDTLKAGEERGNAS